MPYIGKQPTERMLPVDVELGQSSTGGEIWYELSWNMQSRRRTISRTDLMAIIEYLVSKSEEKIR